MKKDYLEKKSTASYYWQKFLGFDPRLRRNILIGGTLMMMIVVTGFFLALISLVQFGGNLVSDVWGEIQESRSRSIAQKDVESALFHIHRFKN